MATNKRVWNPAHHPRDARGRFTKSATRVLKATDAKRAKAAVAGFKPVDLGAGASDGAAWIKKQAAATAAADDAVARYFAGGWKTTHQDLRTKKDAASSPDIVAIDKAMQPLSDDVMLERRVSLKMFAHIPMEQLQGMKVRDAAYQPTALQGSQGEAPDGMVTIHMAVPAGTRAIINPDTGAVVLDRDTETAISRVEPNGRGGYDLYGIVIPKAGATKPGRPAGDPAQDAPEAPNNAPEAPNDGATPDPGDQDTAGGSVAAGGDTTRRRRPATSPRNATGDNAGDQGDADAAGAGGNTNDQDTDGTAQRPRKAAASTAGTRAPGRRRTAAQGGQDGGDDDTDDDAAATAAAAAQVADTAADHERVTGRPAPTQVGELERNDHVRVAGETLTGRTTVTGYVSTPNQIGDQTYVTVSQFPDLQGRRTILRVDPEAPVYVQPPPNVDDVVLYKHPKTGRPAPKATYIEHIRGQVVRDPGREAAVKARIAELSGATTPADAAAGDDEAATDPRPSGPAIGADSTAGTTAPTMGQAPAGFVPREQRSEYRKAYLRGWRASESPNRDGKLEAADMRGEPSGWYDGWSDVAADDPKWTGAKLADAEEIDRLNGDSPYVLRTFRVDPSGEEIDAERPETVPGLATLNVRLVGARPQDKVTDPIPVGTTGARGRAELGGYTYEWGPSDGRGGILPDNAQAPAGARISYRPTGDVVELLANPTVTPAGNRSVPGDTLTWAPELSVPRVAQTTNVGGRDIAVVQYATLVKTTRDGEADLGYTSQFYAVPADAQFTPMSITYATEDANGYRAGEALGAPRSTGGLTTGQYGHLASGKTAAAALSGARAAIEKDQARERYGPTAAANVGVHNQADFDRLNPNAEIQPGDLVVLRAFGKLRTGVAAKVTANKVDALVATPTGAYDNWYGTAQKGIGVRLLRRQGSLDAGRAPAAGARAELFDAVAAAMASPDGKYPADLDPDILRRLDIARMLVNGRPTNYAVQQYEIRQQKLGADTPTAGTGVPDDAELARRLVAGGMARPGTGTVTPPPADPPVARINPEQRRAEITDSLATNRAEETAAAVDAAVDKATPDDPAAARAAALAAKEAELAQAVKALEDFDYRPSGNTRTKASSQRTNAAIRRAADLASAMRRLEREVAALRKPAPPAVPAGGFTPEQLAAAKFIRTRYGWYEVAKVNKKSVKVKAAPGWDDTIPVKRILEVRGDTTPTGDEDDAGDGDDSTAGTTAPDAGEPATGSDVGAGDAGAPETPSVTRQVDPFALIGNAGGVDDALDAAFGPAAPAPAAPVVDVAAIAVDDEVRVAGQWATVTAKNDGQIRVRFPGDRFALVNPSDIRQHRPAVRVDDMFGGTTTFVPQDRSTIGVAARADVGRTRGQQDVQQVSMFDVADLLQNPDQGALLDFLMQMPTAEAPVTAPTLPADAPEPARVNVPEDLTGWTDEQLSGLFAEVSAQTDYDEPGTMRILAEWERREAEMNALLAMVPEDLTALDDDAAAALFAELTAHHGTMDTDVVARLEADLDRRDAAHQAALADLETKRALLARNPRGMSEGELQEALDAAGALDDMDALDRILGEYDRRDAEERAEAAREAMQAQAAAEAEQRAAAAAAEAESRRVAAESAAAEYSKTLAGLLAARSAGYYGGVSTGDAQGAAQLVDPAELARILDGVEIRDASLDQKVRILYAAGRAEAAEEFAGWSTDQLFAELTKKVMGRGGPGFDRDRADRAGREWSRRKLAERLQGDESALHRYAHELLRNDDVTGLTDAQLAAAPAMLAVYDGPFTDEIPSRMRVLDAEIKRRIDLADAKARKAEAGPTGPARLVDPVGAMRDIDRWVNNPHVRGSYGWRGGDAQDRWEKARRIVLGLPEDADARTVNTKWKTDARPLPERAATLLAWYRHLGELADLQDDDRMVYDWMRGPADDVDAPDVPDPLPPADIAKPAEVWAAIKAQAEADLNDRDDYAAAIRVNMAMNRAYGIRINRPAGNTQADLFAVNGKHWQAREGDNRTDGQKAALFVAELRRLAEEDGVDPDDALRYGPHDKGAVRKVKIGRTTVTTNPATEARVAALIAQGHDQASAYATVYGLDESDLRRAEADAAIKASGKTLAQAYREQYDSMVASAFEAAETGTAGHLLNDAGKKLWLEGKLSAIELFSGPSSRAYKYASEELQRWWAEHPPPRMTFAEFKQMAQGDARGAMASATQNAKGSEFS